MQRQNDRCDGQPATGADPRRSSVVQRIRNPAAAIDPMRHNILIRKGKINDAQNGLP